MSFNDDERRFRDNSFENDDDNIDKDFYGLDNEEEGKNYSNDSVMISLKMRILNLKAIERMNI